MVDSIQLRLNRVWMAGSLHGLLEKRHGVAVRRSMHFPKATTSYLVPIFEWHILPIQSTIRVS